MTQPPSVETVHSPDGSARLPPCSSPLATRDPVPLAFSAYDRAGALAFAANLGPKTAAEVVEHARALAQSLAGSDGDASRRRLICRRIAVTRTQCEHLEVLLGGAVDRRDFVASREYDRMLCNATKRLTSLLEQLSRDSSSRSVVVSAQTANVLVK